MPEASLMRMTSSPAEGSLVVPLVMVPVRVAAEADAARMSAIATLTSGLKMWVQPPSAVRGAMIEWSQPEFWKLSQVLGAGLRPEDSRWRLSPRGLFCFLFARFKRGPRLLWSSLAFRIPAARFLPGLRLPLPRANFSLSDSRTPEACPLCSQN